MDNFTVAVHLQAKLDVSMAFRIYLNNMAFYVILANILHLRLDISKQPIYKKYI